MLHSTFAREARESGVAGRPRTRVLFLGDSITEAMRGTQFGEAYDELAKRRAVFDAAFPLQDAKAFGISGDRTQNLLYRIQNGELEFRHPPQVVVVCVGTNNIGRDGDGASDTFLGIRAVVLEVLRRLNGTRVLLTGVLPRGPAKGSSMPSMPPAPGETVLYARQEGTATDQGGINEKYGQPGIHSGVIDDVNARLRAFATSSGDLVSYVDCQKIFLQEDGKGIVPNLMRDALHPTASGMKVWFKTLLPAVDTLLTKPLPSLAQLPNTSNDGSATNHGSLDSIDGGVRSALAQLSLWSPHALCVCDMTKPEHPIVFANSQFFVQTGYQPDEVLGNNCRFLQGRGTDQADVKRMSDAIREGCEFEGRIINYTKSGVPMVNNLILTPLRDSAGNVTAFLGIQRLQPVESMPISKISQLNARM
uniref:Putative LOV domain-containing protein n=1 Tax=Dolichomastix tenuilepis TaxID=195969 RepID=A0A126X4H5_9CHLO|nr:putative LOV domain-containing protein [Dolichomastix tenuilepis]